MNDFMKLFMDFFAAITINGFTLILLFSVFTMIMINRHHVSRFFVNYVTCFSVCFVLFCHITVVLTTNESGFSNSRSITLPWINEFCGVTLIEWQLTFDYVAMVMSVLVPFISLLVHIYSIGYMRHDPRGKKFMALLTPSTFFMLMLVLSKNFVQLFFGWEGVGITSYLLINFWQTRIQANKSAIKAIIVNRIGDAALFLALGLILSLTKTTEFSAVANSLTYYDFYVGFGFTYLDFVAIFLFIGAVGKSAQLGLHTWLPDAMEGPTPVSALIHAATMVTAGVFLLIRSSVILNHSPFTMTVMVIFGSLTAIFGASTAIFQNDIKKIIAYSTCSQLGYMVAICGSGVYDLALYHLVNHAFFKALLFLCAGAIIHSLGDEQDIRKMGFVVKLQPFAAMVMTIASGSIMGLSFLTGFYSKEAIILSSWIISDSVIKLCSAYGLILAAAMTAIYSTRLGFYVFFGSNRNFNRSMSYHFDFPIFISLMVLAILSICGGYFLNVSFFGRGVSVSGSSIVNYAAFSHIVDFEFYVTSFKLFPLFFSLSGIFLCFIVLSFGLVVYNNSFYNGYKFFANKWHFDILIEKFIIRPVIELAKFLTFYIEKGFLEFSFTRLWSKFFIVDFKLFFRKYIGSGGNINNYIFYIVLGFGFLFCFGLMQFFEIDFYFTLIALFFIIVLYWYYNKPYEK